MLVLSRKTGEKILLPGINTTITLVETRHNGCRLGIDAPAEIVVLREEIAGENVPQGNLLEHVPQETKTDIQQDQIFLAGIHRHFATLRSQIEAGAGQADLLKSLDRMRAWVSPETKDEKKTPQAGFVKPCGVLS